MSSETVVQIVAPSDAESRWRLEQVAHCLRKIVEERGGNLWAGWTDALLRIRIQGVPRHRFENPFNAGIEFFGKDKPIRVVTREEPRRPLPDLASGEIPWGTVMREKLTKRLLKLLPEGSRFTFRVLPCGRTLQVVVGTPDTRDETWEDVKKAGGAYRLIRLVWTDEDFAFLEF